METGLARFLSQSLWLWKIHALGRIGSVIRKWAILSFHVVLLAPKLTGTRSRSQSPKRYKAPPKCAVSSKGSPVKALQAMMHKGPGGKPVRLRLTAISMCLLCVYGHAAGLEKSFTAVSNGPEEDFGRLRIWQHWWLTNFTTWKIIKKKSIRTQWPVKEENGWIKSFLNQILIRVKEITC